MQLIASQVFHVVVDSSTCSSFILAISVLYLDIMCLKEKINDNYCQISYNLQFFSVHTLSYLREFNMAFKGPNNVFLNFVEKVFNWQVRELFHNKICSA